MSNNLQEIAIRRFGTRVNLFLGCDRELIMFTGLMSFALAFSDFTILSTIISASLWVFSLYFLRKVAKSDPQMRYVYLRHIKYAKFYSARSTPFCIKEREYK